MYGEFLRSPRGRRVLAWSALFLALQVATPHGHNVNSMSRLALLFAMTEGSFSIEPFVDLRQSFRAPVVHGKTWDWAKAPDKNYHSNKAPGPAFLALPIYWPIDLWLTRGAQSRQERDWIRLRHLIAIQLLLSFLLQSVPLVIVIFLALGRLGDGGVSARAADLACLGALFGNTAVVYANVFFGHALSAWLVIALFLSLGSGRLRWSGFFLAWLPLCEYPLAVLVPVALWSLRAELRSQPLRVARELVIGGLAPATLFFLYHAVCFGGPLVPAMAFNNPRFQDIQSGPNVFGIFHIVPRPVAVAGLLFSPRVGVLWTQPWVLLALGGAWPYLRERLGSRSAAAALGGGGFLALLAVISAFNSWAGGASAGPRYLSALFPLCAVLLAMIYDHWPPWMRRLATVAVWMAVAYSILALTINIIPWRQKVTWFYYLNRFVTGSWRTQAVGVVWMVSLVLLWSGGRRREKTPLAPERRPV